MNPTIFVDTSAWVALIDRNDRLHAAAQRHWHRSLEDGRSFLTSDYVLDESYTLLRRRGRGLAMAMAVHQLVTESRLIEVLAVDAEIRFAAWDLFIRYDDQVLSFTDCTSFALMHRQGLQEAFTFDSDFPTAGFIAAPRP